MNILLIDIDSTIPNLALMKVSQYYKGLGHNVSWIENNPDMAYISCIFKKNKDKANVAAHMLKTQYPNIIIDLGGPGVSLKKTLPPEIENSPPDYTIYPDCDYSIGFTTRGCIRNYSFDYDFMVDCVSAVLELQGTIKHLANNPRQDPTYTQIATRLNKKGIDAPIEKVVWYLRYAEMCEYIEGNGFYHRHGGGAKRWHFKKWPPYPYQGGIE